MHCLTKTYPRAIEALKKLGFTGAVVDFSGGDDQGGADRIVLKTASGQDHILGATPFDYGLNGEMDALEGILGEAIDDHYGGFCTDGPECVSGSFIFDVASGKTFLEGGEWERCDDYDDDDDDEFLDDDEYGPGMLNSLDAALADANALLEENGYTDESEPDN